MTPFDPALATKIAGRFLVGDSPLANPTLDQVRSAAEQLRAAVAEVERLKAGPLWLQHAIAILHESVDLTDPRCPVGSALTRAGLERVPVQAKIEYDDLVADRDRLAAENQRLRSGACSSVIPSTHIACGEGGNYCSEACRLAARVKELEALAGSIADDFDVVLAAHDPGHPQHRSKGGQHHNGPCCSFGNVTPAAVREFRRMRDAILKTLGGK